MAEDGFDWEQMLLGTEENIINDEIEGGDEVNLNSRLYKVLQQVTKSAEEIERFTIEEGLTEIERMSWIIKYTRFDG
jgi:hypothetical protein